MKKLLLFMIVLFAPLCKVHAQTAQETVNWLNAKLPPLFDSQYYRPFTNDTQLFVGLKEIHTHVESWRIEIPYATMTAISLAPCNQDGVQRPFCLSISGRNRQCTYETNECPTSTSYTGGLVTSDPAVAQSLVNALKHMAQLNGAHLVKDNLF
jgi:hypothetical protein